MKARRTGLIILAVHLLMVCTVAVKYAWDWSTLPRVWARAEFTPVQTGRYILLRPCPAKWPAGTDYVVPVRLKASDGSLIAEPGTAADRVKLTRSAVKTCLIDSLPFYLPEGAVLPAAGSDIWVELSVPENQLPRPLQVRLGR